MQTPPNLARKSDRQAQIRSRLLRWYRASRRPLPWRGASPWGVLVSEVMLQQTRVATVLGYYDAFLKRFPSPSALAEATEEDVLRAWEGLGYYRRARNLKAAAEQIARAGWERAFLGKRPPPSEAHRFLRSLPGIGRYSAAAVASIAFGERVAAVDGNTARVLARLDAIEASGTRLLREAEARSTAWMGRCIPGDWNQAWMELGATVCTPSPDCGDCPLQTHCDAFRLGRQEALPIRARSAKVVQSEEIVLCAVARGRVAVCRIEDGPWWHGMYRFPRWEKGARTPNGERLAEVTYTVTRHRVQLTAYLVERLPRGIGTTTRVPLEDLRTLPMPAPQRRVARALLEHFS